MKIAFLFPGQGAEVPRMGLDLAASSSTCARLLAHVARRAGVDILRLLERGGRALEKTEVLQPIIVAISVGAALELRAMGVRPSIVAGHSLGELGAWCGAGCITPETAIDLAATRGCLMGAAAATRPGGMVALLGVSEAQVDEALTLGRQHGWVDLGAHNGPRDWVLSGQREALDAIAASFEVRPVPVAGPWHSSLMAAAAEAFLEHVRAVPWVPEDACFVSSAAGDRAKPEEIPELQAKQLTHPIRWVEAMRVLEEMEVTDYVLVGLSKVMRALVRTNVRSSARLHAAETREDLERAREALS